MEILRDDLKIAIADFQAEPTSCSKFTHLAEISYNNRERQKGQKLPPDLVQVIPKVIGMLDELFETCYALHSNTRQLSFNGVHDLNCVVTQISPLLN